MSKYKEQYKIWKENITNQENLRKELIDIEGNDAEIEDRFYKELEFGTGGLRGKIGAGTNRMNLFSVAKVTTGVGRYILNNQKKKSVVIAYDSRNFSKEFAFSSASVLSKMGIKAYIFKNLMPTPLCSYAVRELNCGIGIVITASHNPSIYNGYKVYGDDGCQVTDNDAKAIYEEIKKVEYDFSEDFSCAEVEIISEDIAQSFYEKLLKTVLDSGEKKIKICYTPLYGAGNIPVRTVLKMRGFDVAVVKEQENPNGNFPTCPYPNPEEKEALKVGLEFAQKENADLLLATDPDCDRVGIAVKTDAEFKLITGNEVGILLLNYLFETWDENKGALNSKYIVKTIVSTPMAYPICEKYGVKVRDTLTGFKYIGEQIGMDTENFLFGFEESYGYLCHTFARDKDAVGASLLIAEMANYYSNQGKSLYEKLKMLYEEYGYFLCELQSVTMDGVTGVQKIKENMSKIRSDNFRNILNYTEIKKRDFSDGEIIGVKSNVIELSNKDFTVLFRPSGTEPKMKIYYMVKGESEVEAHKKIDALKTFFNKYFKI